MGKQAAVYLAAAIEYCTSELLEMGTKVASKGKKSTLKPRHIALAVRNDDELNKLLATVTIASGGVVPNVHPAIAKKKRARRRQGNPRPHLPVNRLHGILHLHVAAVSLDTGS